MPGKQRYLRSIDLPIAGAFDAGPDPAGTQAIAPPVQASIGAPTNLQLTTAIDRSAASATAQIGATWYPPSGVAPSGYLVQWSLSNTFPDPGTSGQPADDEATTIRSLTPATTYYVRVLAIVANVQGAWSDTASIVTATDTTPPAAPTSQAASFQGIGDLVITWTNPTSSNFRDVEIGIYSDASKTTTYALLHDATGRRVWTAAENLAATSNAGDPSVYVELRSLSWGGIFSSAVNTGTITKAAPSAPTVTVDFTGANAVYTITPPSDAAQISFVADTAITARLIGVVGRYVYTFDQNRLDHSGTADPVLSYSFTAIDGLKQASSATSGTATNAAPSAPTVTLSGGQNQLVAAVTTAPAADFLAYEYVWKRDGSTVLTLESASAEQQYATGVGDEGAHSWTCTVRQKDLFAQYSSATVSSTVVLDTLTISYLRSSAYYSDDAGGTFTPPASGTLAALKDGITASGGVTYSA